MKTKNISRLLAMSLAAAAMGVGLAPSLHANLVANPGFETGNFSGWTQGGNTSFTSVDTSLPHSGTFSADMGPVSSNGLLSQALSTTPGDLYDLSFWLQNNGGNPNNFSVSWDGVGLVGGAVPPLPGTNLPAFGYTQYLFTGLVATTASTPLQFSFLQNPSFFHLDDVSVIPEPTTVVFGLALVGVCAGGMRKRVRGTAATGVA